jgi:hypothetical protein
MLQEGCRGPYIALRVERKPSDQIDFDVGWRYILEDGGRILQKLVEKSPHKGPGGTRVGPAGPTWRRLVLPFVLVPSGVFYSLLVYLLSRSNFVLFLN